jgi:hypothetical protein
MRTTLRGAPVEVDPRRAADIIIAFLLAALLVLTASLFVSAAHRNAQISSLQHHGATVEVTVTRCTGQLGGSGSNAAAYNCVGTFVLGGKRFSDALPDHTFRRSGTKIQLVSATDDPHVLATGAQVRRERDSVGVFVPPSVLLIAVAGLAVAVLVRRRKGAAKPRS